MATSPLSGHRPPIHVGGIRRSFTQPPRSLSFHEKAGLDPSDSTAEILYSHPRARIISFTPPTDVRRSISSPVSIDLDYPVDTIETLPWASSTEEVLASGSLIIEKICGSTNFLKSGTKPLHPLMRNSQCWCVDAEATLVMRVGAFKYYRIELPYSTEEERGEVQQLKEVLRRILRFEATPCPFKRGFHVDLPESATTPRKKGPWKRRPGSVLSSPVGSMPSPLSLRKSRTCSPSADHSGRCEGQPSPPNSLDESKDSFVDNGDVAEKNYEAQQNAPGNDDANARAGLDQEDRQLLGSSNETSLVSDLRPIEDRILESSNGQLKVQIRRDNIVAQESEGLDAGNASSSSSAKSSIHGRDSESRDGTYDGYERESGLSADSYSSIANPDITLAHPQPPKGTIHSGLEGLIEEPSANSKHRLESFNEHAYEDTSENAEVFADELSSNSDVPPGEPEAQAQLRTQSPACSPVRCLVHQAPQQRSTEVWMDGFEAPAISSESDTQMSDTASVSSRADSFHSIASLGSRSSDVNANSAECSEATPLADAHHPLTLSSHHHTRDTSDMTVTLADRPGSTIESPMSPVRPSTATSEGPSTPSLLRSSASDSSWPDVETPSAVSADLVHRRRLKTKRSLSLLTPSSTDLTASPQSPRGRHLTGAILQKARNLALGKPIDFLVMLVHIFFRIADGATLDDVMNGELFRFPSDGDAAHRGQHSSPGQTDSRQGEGSEEDDYGVPIRGRSRSAAPILQNDDDADSLFDLD